MFLGAARNAVFPFRVFSGRKECPLINNMVICESCTECPAVVCIHPLRKLSLPPPRGIRRSWKDYGSRSVPPVRQETVRTTLLFRPLTLLSWETGQASEKFPFRLTTTSASTSNSFCLIPTHVGVSVSFKVTLVPFKISRLAAVSRT